MGHDRQRGTGAAAIEADLIDETLAAHEAMSHISLAWHTPEWLELELSTTQLKALFVLGCDPSFTVGQLARKLGLAKPAASILVDKLVQAGYVERTEDVEDRRRTNIRLSPTGDDLVRRLTLIKREQMRLLLARLSPADLRALCKGLRALASAARQDSAAAACAPCGNESGEPIR